jgi:predicted DNA-binding helix-hairpin-helix protein
MRSVHKIIHARRYRKLNWEHLKSIGISMNRAKYFITCDSKDFETKDRTPSQLKSLIMQESSSKFRKAYSSQLNLFDANALPTI